MRCTDYTPSLSTVSLTQAVGRFPGNVGRLTWTFRGSIIAACRVSFEKTCVHLWHDESLKQRIDVEWTPCHFGGQRCWFTCPTCGRRLGTLYFVANSWVCRRCGRVKYSSQQEHPAARLARRIRKLRGRLHASPNLLKAPGPKPKGMHWKTYFKLISKEQRLRKAWLERVATELELH